MSILNAVNGTTKAPSGGMDKPLGILGFLQSPDFKAAAPHALMALGKTLTAIDQNRPADFSPIMQAGVQHQQGKQIRGILDAAGIGISPQQRGILGAYAEANPSGALGVLAEHAFQQPESFWDQHKVVGDQVVGPDPRTGGVRSVYSAPSTPQTRQPPAGYRFADGGALEYIPGGPADPAVRQAQRGNGITIGPDGTVQIGGNPQGQLGRSARNQEEKALATETNLLSRMSGLGELVGIGPDGRMSTEARDMLTYQSQAEDWFTRQAEKLGVEPSEVQRQAVGRRAQFNTTVEQLFNAYRQEITGAAAAVQELERLKKSFINIDMSPSQFEAAYAQYMGELQRSMRVRNKLIRQGFDPSTQQGGATFDREFLLGGDDDPAQRFSELVAGGLSEDDAYARLIQEGY
ncbi:MAG: hypothetical protein AAF674_15645 [Pseudomonadota bacterium]